MVDGLENVRCETETDRRGFLQVTFMAGMAAGAAGLTGWLVAQGEDAPITMGMQATPPALRDTLPSLPTGDESNVQAQLAATQSKNFRLQSELNNAISQAEALRAELKGYKVQVVDMQSRLESRRSWPHAHGRFPQIG